MCGIAGFINPSLSLDQRQALAVKMADAIRSRGPDAAGEWHESEIGLSFAFRRLAIIDLSSQGNQPMSSESGRFTIVFNGEVYNFASLRAKLEKTGHRFRGHSDTEVMLASFEEWGIDNSLSKFNGMFAFAVYDTTNKTLTLARDRVGIKPLYYGFVGGVFAFASELKALKPLGPEFFEVSTESLAYYLRYGYVPAPWSIFKSIYKLEAGSALTIDLERPLDSASSLKPKRYWSLPDKESLKLYDIPVNFDEQVTVLDNLLSDAVSLRMVADVPLGAFLSGGIDSSTVVALMQKNSTRPVRTFSIGFYEDEYNEAKYAASIAKHLGTEHTELYVSAKEALSVIPLMPSVYDEPFGDSSEIPTYILSRLTREHVTVSLSGDGGDELFCGYNRYVWADKIWRMLSPVPVILRGPLGQLIQAIPVKGWDYFFKIFRPLLPQTLRFTTPGDKAHKLGRLLTLKTKYELYERLITHWENPSLVVTGLNTALPHYGERYSFDDSISYLDYMTSLDFYTYLPDDILVKVDRASMAVSLEARVPVLDHRVVEFSRALPLESKYHAGRTKRILREVLYRYVPKQMLERPKQGFGIPVGEWLRDPLKDWAESLLDERLLKEQGYFIPTVVKAYWSEHLSTRRNWQYLLWDLLMFQAWLNDWKDN
ncbi:MAG: asparagine synthase (glutamine-hydrolyzing) [Candidatus Dadabacteria bacterium]|nr:MAG: asparagine synthase (glutamine-hydrolyzing) [Candidatus Dadabacteria bacterium]